MAFGLGVAKGMLTTISHLVKPPVTIQYPEERLEMPIWTRGRPRLIYEIDTGELRCTACGACALACPVDVIKIEQHPSPIKGKILDRFDIDMAGCIECALCVEACPFRAITMAPDFEMASTYDRAVDLVYDMYELRIAGTPEIDAGMEHIQGVKRGLKGAAPAPARPAPAARGASGPVAGQATGATASPTSSSATGT
ncbi:MAG TPA: NADH-quinone oxidoreductase subunit I, partial [Chloroflexota bacterium]